MLFTTILFLIITLIIDGVSSATPVDVNPKNPVLKVGQSFTFKCTVADKILYCRIAIPGRTSGYNLNEYVQRKPDYWYEGSGLSSGQCGITIARIRDEHNGLFQCTMGTESSIEEIVGSTNVTVARSPLRPPDLIVYPEPDRSLYGAYKENTTIFASCTVGDSRPKANLSWYIGDEQITDDVGREEITEFPGNLFTVSQTFKRRLTWKDNSKILRCETNHIANDNIPLSTINQIRVVFPPRSRDKTIEKFGLMVGEDEMITVQINANPRPTITWNVGGENVYEGRQDSTQRFTASQIRNLGNDTWETSLTISAVSPEDVDRRYLLKAQNELGEQQYRVVISTEAAPEATKIPEIKATKMFDLLKGSNEIITLQIQATTKPNVTWKIDDENILEGGQDSTQRFTVSKTENLGNEIWNTSITISAVTPEDVQKMYIVSARNEFGEAQYVLRLSIKEVPITEECLTCLCEAVTDCDFTRQCINAYPVICGPFLISRNFWLDGRDQNNNSTQNWKECALDPLCAANTVRNYANKYSKDCNGDHKIDCTDFALIHHNGPFGCSVIKPTFRDIKEKLDICLTEIMQ